MPWLGQSEGACLGWGRVMAGWMDRSSTCTSLESVSDSLFKLLSWPRLPLLCRPPQIKLELVQRCQLAARLLEARGCLAALQHRAFNELLLDACELPGATVSSGKAYRAAAAAGSSGTAEAWEAPGAAGGDSSRRRRPEEHGRAWQWLGLGHGEQALPTPRGMQD